MIIGIDNYTQFPRLRGAVADADEVRKYLERDLGVPDCHIRNLRNEQATREVIISHFYALQTDARIQPGDALFIYYAGHGGTIKAPQDWETGDLDNKIQMIVPCDVGESKNDSQVTGIPDRTIGALLDGLAEAKGDNIVCFGHTFLTSYLS